MRYDAGSCDVAVVGAGHAGIEAALAAARLGLDTVCFTINMDAIGNMPCNPAIGGTGKGHLVRELDALGGEMARAADQACIQYRMLNRGKGPAVHSLRAQADRRKYQAVMKHTLLLHVVFNLPEADFLMPVDGFVDGVDDVENLLVFQLSPAVHNHIALQIPGLIDACRSAASECWPTGRWSDSCPHPCIPAGSAEGTAVSILRRYPWCYSLIGSGGFCLISQLVRQTGSYRFHTITNSFSSVLLSMFSD